MNQLRVVNTFPTILNVLIGALLLLVCLKFPVWGVIELERKLDVYPLVSQQTIATLDKMSVTLGDFSDACEKHQAAEWEMGIFQDCHNHLIMDIRDESCEERREKAGKKLDQATADMYAAVAARKALARDADWGLLKSMVIGGQGYTHSTWLCAPAYATFSTQINVGFTPTYDSTS